MPTHADARRTLNAPKPATNLTLVAGARNVALLRMTADFPINFRQTASIAFGGLKFHIKYSRFNLLPSLICRRPYCCCIAAAFAADMSIEPFAPRGPGFG